MRLHGPEEPVYTIGVAARLLKVNPQVLRMIERSGLVEPARTEKHTRLYSENDLVLLQRICYLTRVEHVNLAGVRTILRLEMRETRIFRRGPDDQDDE
ncbi:MAG: MerR family transcriptional regulator [Bacillota bacterium]